MNGTAFAFRVSLQTAIAIPSDPITGITPHNRQRRRNRIRANTKNEQTDGTCTEIQPGHNRARIQREMNRARDLAQESPFSLKKAFHKVHPFGSSRPLPCSFNLFPSIQSHKMQSFVVSSSPHISATKYNHNKSPCKTVQGSVEGNTPMTTALLAEREREREREVDDQSNRLDQCKDIHGGLVFTRWIVEEVQAFKHSLRAYVLKHA